jgi:hypothetical protein
LCSDMSSCSLVLVIMCISVSDMSSRSLVLMIMCISVSDMSPCSLDLVIICISAAICPPVVFTRTRLQEDISLHLYTLSPEQDYRRTYHLCTLSLEQDYRRTYHLYSSGDNVYKCSDISSYSLVLVIMCISAAICPPAVLFW